MKESIGWAASIIILITTIGQIRKQWKAGTSKGVSLWLFIGNIVAAGLFATYAVLIHNLIYIVTNLLKGLISSIDLIKTNPDQAEQLVSKGVEAASGKALPVDLVKASFKSISFTEDPIASSLRLHFLQPKQ